MAASEQRKYGERAELLRGGELDRASGLAHVTLQT
jgi:hypothetical protein